MQMPASRLQWNRELLGDDVARVVATLKSGASGVRDDTMKPFSDDDWAAFVAAVSKGQATAVATHLFPKEQKKDDGSKTLIPERDIWFRSEHTPGSKIWVVLHIHYLGT